MRDNGLQQIAVDARNNKSNMGIFQIITIIIFIFPIIKHSFMWGWIYPIIALLALMALGEGLGALGIVLGVLLMAGSIWLCRKRVIIMREKRTLANRAKLYTPSSMLDDDY